MTSLARKGGEVWEIAFQAAIVPPRHRTSTAAMTDCFKSMSYTSQRSLNGPSRNELADKARTKLGSTSEPGAATQARTIRWDLQRDTLASVFRRGWLGHRDSRIENRRDWRCSETASSFPTNMWSVALILRFARNGCIESLGSFG